MAHAHSCGLHSKIAVCWCFSPQKLLKSTFSSEVLESQHLSLTLQHLIFKEQCFGSSHLRGCWHQFTLRHAVSVQSQSFCGSCIASLPPQKKCKASLLTCPVHVCNSVVGQELGIVLVFLRPWRESLTQVAWKDGMSKIQGRCRIW